MGHTKPEMIKDLLSELEKIRALPHLKEKKEGVFYYKSLPFLHFHDKEGRRWADVKTTTGHWQKIDVPFAATPKERKSFLLSVQKRHGEISGLNKAGRNSNKTDKRAKPR